MRLFPLFLIGLFGTCFAISDTVNSGFFRELEQRLRDDYRACTGDSSRLPLKALVRWKRSIDSMTGLPDYPGMARAYAKETGGSSARDRPCVVILWNYRKDSIAAEKARVEELRRRHDDAARSESLAVAKEIASLAPRPCSLGSIPLGVSRESFAWLAAREGFGPLSDEGHYLRCAGVPFGERFYLGAFHFDTLGRLCAYELEGDSFPADSLDSAVRSQAELLSSTFEKTTGSPPRRIRRIGRREIAEGKLSIYKMWSGAGWSVTTGLAVHDYRYYAKAVVANRPIPTE